MDAHGAAEVRRRARDALALFEGHGRLLDALRSATLLVGRYPASAMAHNLLGFLHKRTAARAGGGDLSNTHYQEARCAYSVAARLAPNCIVTAVALAEALADCHEYSKSMTQLNQAHKIVVPHDPAPYYAGSEHQKFGYHTSNTESVRLRNAKEMLPVALDKLRDKVETQVIRKEMDKLLVLSSNETVSALNRAKALANEWPFSGRAQLLLIYIQLQHDFVTRPGISKANIFRCTMSALKELQRKFPSSLVMGLLHAALLDELEDPTAVDKCRETLAIKQPDDPIKHAIPYDSFKGKDCKERVHSARLRIKELHDRILNEAKMFWGSFSMKDRISDVRVDDLAQYAGTCFQLQPKTLYDACNFFKKHHQWDFIYVGALNKPCVDSNSLRIMYKKVHGCQQLDSVLGDRVYAIRPMHHDSSHLDAISLSYFQDTMQHDFFRLPAVEDLLDSMLSETDAKVVCELDVLNLKAFEELRITRDIRKMLSGLPQDISSTQYKESCTKIQSLWTEAIHNQYFDYREIILPLAWKFQWAQLKNYMAKASVERVLKQPELLLILEPFCFKCWEKGHRISNCNLCLLCSSESHKTSNCPTTRKPSPGSRLVGCAEQGQEFYAACQPSSRHAIGLVTVQEGNVSVDQLVQEFSKMFDWNWKWAAMEQGQQEFHMKFPNVPTIEMLAKTPITLENSGALIRVNKKVSAVRPKGKLSLVWVRVKDVPKERKDPECLREVGSMIGLVKYIDIPMLEEFDIVRMMVYVKDHDKIPPLKEYIVDGDIYYIDFCLESVVEMGCTYGSDDNEKAGNAYTNEWSYAGPPQTEHMEGRSQVQSDTARNRQELPGKECNEPLGSCNLKLEGLGQDMSPNDAGKPVPGEAMDINTKGQEEESFGEKKVSLQGQYYEKGESAQTQHQVHPSVLYGSGRLCMPSSVTEEGKPLPSKEYIILGEVIPEDKVSLFAYYCKAAERCPSMRTICHFCSLEGVTDLSVNISKIVDHVKRQHNADESVECDECHTRARTCADIRRHYYFAHKLPKGWWMAHISTD